MEGQYNVTLYLNNNKGTTKVYNAKVSFSYNPDTYGNGYYMGIESDLEPFGFSSYDIRYDTEFNKEEKMVYIMQFFSNRFNGKNGAWKMIGIKIHEAEF